MIRSKQKIFNIVVVHMLSQNAKSIVETEFGTSCGYRGDQGRSCAIGCLIKDEFYNPDYEGQPCRDKRVKEALAKSGIEPESNQLMLSRLQHIHDNYVPSQWANQLGILAHRYNLKYKGPMPC